MIYVLFHVNNYKGPRLIAASFNKEDLAKKLKEAEIDIVSQNESGYVGIQEVELMPLPTGNLEKDSILKAIQEIKDLVTKLQERK